MQKSYGFCLTIIYYFELFSLHVRADSRKCHFKNPYRAFLELLEPENFPVAQQWWATIFLEDFARGQINPSYAPGF